MISFYTSQIQILSDFTQEEIFGFLRLTEQEINKEIRNSFFTMDLINRQFVNYYDNYQKLSYFTPITSYKIVDSPSTDCSNDSPCILFQSSVQASEQLKIKQCLRATFYTFVQNKTRLNISIFGRFEDLQSSFYFPYYNQTSDLIADHTSLLYFYSNITEQYSVKFASQSYHLISRYESLNTQLIVESNIFSTAIASTSMDYLNRFDDLRVIFLHPDLSIANPDTCHYFCFLQGKSLIKKSKFYSSDCFDTRTVELIDKYISSDIDEYGFVESFVSPVSHALYDDQEYDYRVTIAHLPTISNEFHTAKRFNLDFRYKLIIFKSNKNFEIIKSYFFYRYLMILFSVSFFNLVSIYLLECLIVLFVLRMAKKISEPFNYLIDQLGKLGNDSIDYTGLDNLKFEEDDEINKLFSICVDLIKRGFVKEDEREDENGDFARHRSNYKILGNCISVNEEQMNAMLKKQISSFFAYSRKNSQAKGVADLSVTGGEQATDITEDNLRDKFHEHLKKKYKVSKEIEDLVSSIEDSK